MDARSTPPCTSPVDARIRELREDPRPSTAPRTSARFSPAENALNDEANEHATAAIEWMARARRFEIATNDP